MLIADKLDKIYGGFLQRKSFNLNSQHCTISQNISSQIVTSWIYWFSSIPSPKKDLADWLLYLRATCSLGEAAALEEFEVLADCVQLLDRGTTLWQQPGEFRQLPECYRRDRRRQQRWPATWMTTDISFFLLVMPHYKVNSAKRHPHSRSFNHLVHTNPRFLISQRLHPHAQFSYFTGGIKIL